MKKILTIDCEWKRETRNVTQKPSSQVEGGWNNIPGMGLAVLGMQADFDKGAPVQYWYAEIPDKIDSPSVRLYKQPRVQEELDTADLIIGFNSYRFDRVLLESAGFDMTHFNTVHYDIMLEYGKAKQGGTPIWSEAHTEGCQSVLDNPANRITLQSLGNALGVGNKSLSGKLAPQLWQGAELLYHRYTKGQGFQITEQDRLCAEANMASASYLYQTVIDYCLRDVAITRQIFDKLVESKGAIEIWDYRVESNIQLQFAIPKMLATDEQFIEDDTAFIVHRKRGSMDGMGKTAPF